MTEFKRDVLKAREIISEEFTQALDKANELWYGALRLIITLSSSFLLLSIALVQQLFPPLEGVSLPKFLIMGWILLFLSIIFGIVAELEAAIFHGSRASIRGKILYELNRKIAQGIVLDTVEAKDNTDYIMRGNIFWGAVSFNSFIIAILCICLALLRGVIASYICNIIFLSSVIFFTGTNFYLIRKRNKIGT